MIHSLLHWYIDAKKMAYISIPTELLTEYATQYDQIILRYRQSSDLEERRGGLLMLSDPAAKTIQVQSLAKKDSAGRPIVFPVKISDNVRFTVQPHHLKVLLAKYEHVNGRPYPMTSFVHSSGAHHPLTPPKSAPSSPEQAHHVAMSAHSPLQHFSEDESLKRSKRKRSVEADSIADEPTSASIKAQQNSTPERRNQLAFYVKRAKSLWSIHRSSHSFFLLLLSCVPKMTTTFSLRRCSGKQKFIITNDRTGHRVRFGLKGYKDFTQHHDVARKRAYLKRHAQDSKSMKKAGFWARALLWNQETLKKSISKVQKERNIRISMK